MWDDIKLTATSKQTKKTLIDTDNSMVATRGRGVEVSKGKGDRYMVTEDDLTLGGGHTVQYTDHVS